MLIVNIGTEMFMCKNHGTQTDVAIPGKPTVTF